MSTLKVCGWRVYEHPLKLVGGGYMSTLKVCEWDVYESTLKVCGWEVYEHL